ncbi:MAG: Ig-like domain-containing protein [Gammaproteobacteria bacterium]
MGFLIKVVAAFLGKNNAGWPSGHHVAMLALALGLTLPVAMTAQAGPYPGRFAAGHILVTSRDTVATAAFTRAIGRYGATDRGRIRATRLHVVNVLPGQEQATVQALAFDPEVESAELDRLVDPEVTVANDPYYLNAWHLAKIGAPTAWDTAKGNGVIVAILDSGVDGTHPDLVNKMVPGWNLVDNNSNTSDVYGHGTEVAGVVGAASNNGIGVTSIAWGASIMPVRVALTSGSAYISTIANGIIWAADHGAQIANASFASLTGSTTIQSAADYMRSKGGLVVVAAGNSGTLDSTPNNSSVISVSATDSSDTIASWSSYGPYVDVAAPGAGIWTTTNGGGYSAVSGTSFSSPLTAGVLALMKSADPSLSNTVLESILKSTAVDLGTPGYDQYYGYGRINAAAAVAAAAAYNVTSDTTAPTVSITSPTGGTVQSTVAVTVAASDNVGVTRVDLYAGTTLIGSATTAPYSFAWDTKTVADGTVKLTAYAYDKAGNKGSSASVSVTVFNFVDTTAPTVSITSPTGGTVQSTVAVTVAASDNVGVTRVDLYAGTTLIGSATTAPYSFAWDTKTVADGTVKLTAYAYDKAGNKGSSASVSVTVFSFVDTTAPTVSITSPTGGTVQSTVAVTVAASDNVGVTRVDLYAGTTLIGSATTAPYSFAWDTKTVADGTVKLTAYAYDKAGNKGTSATLSVTVSNIAINNPPASDTTSPSVSIISPTGGTVAAAVTVTVAASDNVGVARVDLYAGTTLIGSATTAPYSFTWDTKGIANGALELTAYAYDAAGNKGTSANVSVTVSNVVIDSTAPGTTPPSPSSGGGGGGGALDGLSLFTGLLTIAWRARAQSPKHCSR